MMARNPRLFALAITIGVALLAGVFTGITAGASQDCGSNTSDTNQHEEDNKDVDPPAAEEPHDDTDPFEKEEPSRNLPGGGGGAQQAADKEDGDCGGFSVTAAGVGFLGALLAGVVATFFIPAADTRMVTHPGSLPSGPGAVGSATGSFPVVDTSRAAHETTIPVMLPPDNSRLIGERGSLVNALIYVRDRATSQAIADRVRSELAAVGVQETAPTGAAFDPAQHEAGGFTATDDPAKHGLISGVEVVGYTDNTTVLRPPVVTVFRAGNQ